MRALKEFLKERWKVPSLPSCAVAYWCNLWQQERVNNGHLNTTTMGRSKKRRVPVTTPTHNSMPKSLTTRSTIRKFHVLLKRRARLETKPRTFEISRELEEIEQEMDSLGGLEQYQEMSVVGQSKERGGGSHKFLISWLRELHFPAGEGDKGTLRYVYLPSVQLEIHV